MNSTVSPVAESIFERLSRLDKNMQFIIVLKTRKALLTPIKFLHDPTRHFLIFVASSKVLRDTTAEQKKAFQMIIPFNLVGKETLSQSWTDLHTVKYEMVGPLLEKVLKCIPPSRTILTVSEEVLMYFAASLRQRLQIPGLDCCSVLRFTDKVTMKNVCAKNSIPSAKFVAFSVSQTKTADQLCLEMAKHSLMFPVFIKPQRSCGSYDAVKIASREDLNEWYRSHADTSPYLCEEFIDGTEMVAYMVVKNSIVQNLKIFKNARPIYHFVKLRKPFGKIEVDLHCHLFQCSAKFVAAVVRAFSPLQNGVFAVEFFEKFDGSFIFSENCARLPGGSYTDIMQVTEHFNVEAFHLTAGLCCDAVNSPQQPYKYSAYIRYPTIPGIVVKKNDIPKHIRSQQQAHWRFDTGQKLKAPVELSGKYEMLKLNLYNTDCEQLRTDFEFLLNNFTPFVVSS